MLAHHQSDAAYYYHLAFHMSSDYYQFNYHNVRIKLLGFIGTNKHSTYYREIVELISPYWLGARPLGTHSLHMISGRKHCIGLIDCFF